MKGGKLIPFSGNKMLEYVDPLAEQDAVRRGAPIAWIENAPFEETLTYDGYWTGRSAIRFQFRGAETGRIFSMGIAALDKIAKRMSNGVVFGRWEFRKQGANYGVVPCEASK